MAFDPNLKTLRATPEKGSDEMHHTYDFIQHHVQFYGQTEGIKRAQSTVEDYFDVEFECHEDAWDVAMACEIPGMELSWAPHNIMNQLAPVPAIASYRPPRFDLDHDSKEPSLPVPCNNPYKTVWDEAPRKNPTDPVYIVPYPPTSIQRDPPDPRPPYKARHWPRFPV